MKHRKVIALFISMLMLSGSIRAEAMSISEMEVQIQERETELAGLQAGIEEAEGSALKKQSQIEHMDRTLSYYKNRKHESYGQIEDLVYGNEVPENDSLEIESLVQQKQDVKMVAGMKFLDITGLPGNDGDMTLQDMEEDIRMLSKARDDAMREMDGIARNLVQAKEESRELEASIDADRQVLAQMIEDAKPKFEGVVLQYSSPYNITSSKLTKSGGIAYYGNHKETYYTQSMFPGHDLYVPGKHVADDGTVRDGDGYICVAADYSFLPKGSRLMTTLGPAKVYDTGCAYGVVDIYTNW